MKVSLFFLVCAAAFIFNVNGHPKLKQSENAIVRIPQGELQGERVVSELTGGQFYSFRGIPYTRPPVGSLRFQAPTEAPSWTGVRNATYHRSFCLQPASVTGGDLQGSEDCLYLNVYTPQLPSGSGRNLLPVMVYIHGGGFYMGSGDSDTLHPDYLVEKGVVLVTMNYRLGVMGFFGLNNSRVSLNNGLKDQLASLKWVQANIEQFGGNRSQVTIFGESAGSGSVGFHIVSPATTGYFHGAISESGNAIYEGFFYAPSEARRRALGFARDLGITTENEDELVNSLLNVTAERLVAAQEILPLYLFKYIQFRPTIDSGADAFLPDSPLNIMKAGRYQKVPYITGFNSYETEYFLQDYLHNATLWNGLSFEQFVPDASNLAVGSPESLRLANEIKQVYFGNVTPTVQDIEALVNVFSDSNFIYTTLRSARFHVRSSSAPVYVYQFSYVGSLSTSQYLQFGYPFRGASHTDELGYIFNYYTVPVLRNSSEYFTLQNVTTIWTNFAKTGNPSEGLAFQWQSLTSSRHVYLDIDDAITVKNLDELHPARFALWHRIYENIDN